MTYDDDLAHRIRELLSTEGRVDERSMFGGLAFMINGNMAMAAGDGGMMVRVPPAETATLLEFAHTEPMIMSGREIRGWIHIDDDGLHTKRQLTRWVTLAADFARKLPPK